MFHFKAPGSSLHKDFLGAAWGAFIRFVEVGDDQRALRQIEIFENGNVLRYDREHWCDDFGVMVAHKFSRKKKWAVFFPGAEPISPAEFEKVWRTAKKSKLWAQLLERSRAEIWGAF